MDPEIKRIFEASKATSGRWSFILYNTTYDIISPYTITLIFEVFYFHKY